MALARFHGLRQCFGGIYGWLFLNGYIDRKLEGILKICPVKMPMAFLLLKWAS